MKLSIVATLYQSAAHVEEFCRRVSNAARQVAEADYEIILVNDGSPDQSLTLAIKLAETDSHITVVDLSRNFGHHKAMMTGLTYATGDHVFLLDSDLEEEPEWLAGFFQQLTTQDCDVVYGVQENRKGGLMERWSGRWFYFLFRLLTGVALPANVVTARLMSRRYVDALLRHDEREIFMAGLWQITGFDQQPRIVNKHHTSTTTYTLGHKIALVVNSVTSFSNAPLVSIFYCGVLISLVAASYIGYLMIIWMFFADPPSGWTSVMASIWLLGGMIISFVGIVGIYLSKIFSETKRRPYTIVRRIYGDKNS